MSSNELARALLDTANMFQQIVMQSDIAVSDEAFREGISAYPEEVLRLSSSHPMIAKQCAMLEAFHLTSLLHQNCGSVLPDGMNGSSLEITEKYLRHVIPSFGENGTADEQKLNNIIGRATSALVLSCGSEDMANMIKTAIVSNTLGESANSAAKVAR